MGSSDSDVRVWYQGDICPCLPESVWARVGGAFERLHGLTLSGWVYTLGELRDGRGIVIYNPRKTSYYWHDSLTHMHKRQLREFPSFDVALAAFMMGITFPDEG